MPVAYDRWLAPAVFQPSAVDLAQRAARLSPRRVLEIAAGTGVLTRELVASLPAAEITATDLNTAMVEFGSRQVPAAAWQVANALHLPFDDKQFDLVVCQFGVMFFPDKAAAFGEARRVLTAAAGCCLTPGGTVHTRSFAAAWRDRSSPHLAVSQSEKPSLIGRSV
jgi:ubiquinone/menaquinone biosynthesis C-methylase UbiE